MSLENNEREDSFETNDSPTSGEEKNSPTKSFREYYQRKGKEMGDRTEKRLNAMDIAARKKVFFLVFGLMFVLLIFNFVRSFFFRPKVSATLTEMVRDSIIDWSKVDTKDLSVMNLDSMREVSQASDSVNNDFYFK
ncbi:MAG: hypothetical protein K6F48_12845 [Paludibacteraceae bacterium]|nr:hypothetical protein [Paludibacteraceae bacterium]